MAKLTIRTLKPDETDDGEDPIEVDYSPPEISLSKASQFGEIAIPGLEQPLLQFVRGDAETITLDLFFDGTTSVVGAPPTDVAKIVNRLAKLVSVKGEYHTPPLVHLSWGTGFPGNNVGHNFKSWSSFTGVALSVTRKYTLFDAEGLPLRATVNISLKRYITLGNQLNEIGFQSADHTRLHIVAEGETLPLIAHDAFGDARLWWLIADHNNLADARDLVPGMRLELPPLVP